MAHTLICGVTESGKTTLAHALAARFVAEGQRVIIFDPVGTGTAAGSWPSGPLVKIFDDENLFFEYLADPRVSHAHVFIDEAGEIFNASKRENLWLLTRGRHFGFNVWLIAQRPKMLLPSARGQCSKAYIFRLAIADMREIMADFGHDYDDKIVLDRGDCICLSSGTAEIVSFNVFALLPKT